MRDPRSHLYRTIHKAIRALLGELTTIVGRTDFASPAELEALNERVRRDFRLLSAHAEHEDAHILPLLEAHAPDVARALGAAHEEQEEAMPSLLAELGAIDPNAPDVADRSDAFRVRLSRYTAELLDHMADEEELAMTALYARLDEATLVGVHEALVGSVPPAEMMEWLVYMLPSIPRPDRAGMLAGMREGAPPEVFGAVLDLARRVLAPVDFEDLERRLGGVARAA